MILRRELTIRLKRLIYLRSNVYFTRQLKALRIASIKEKRRGERKRKQVREYISWKRLDRVKRDVVDGAYNGWNCSSLGRDINTNGMKITDMM